MEDKNSVKLIDQRIARALAFANKKYGDTPTDALQLTPKKYVDSNAFLTGFTKNDDLSDPTYPIVGTIGSSATLTNGNAGEADIVGGKGNGTGYGQYIYIEGGQGGATGTGGDVGIFGGKGGSVMGDGGGVVVWAGQPDFINGATGKGGRAQILAGSSNDNNEGSDVEIRAGSGYINGVGSGKGGDVSVFPGGGGGAGSIMGAMIVYGHYASDEYSVGNITGTKTIDWARGNVQYATMTGNVTLTFANPVAGARYLLHLAGAFTPTFPTDVRWSGGSAPAATATAGKKDIYTVIYSGIESLYDVLQSPNYAIA